MANSTASRGKAAEKPTKEKSGEEHRNLEKGKSSVSFHHAGYPAEMMLQVEDFQPLGTGVPYHGKVPRRSDKHGAAKKQEGPCRVDRIPQTHKRLAFSALNKKNKSAKDQQWQHDGNKALEQNTRTGQGARANHLTWVQAPQRERTAFPPAGHNHMHQERQDKKQSHVHGGRARFNNKKQRASQCYRRPQRGAGIREKQHSPPRNKHGDYPA